MAVQSLSPEQLPALTPEQREVALKLRIAEDQYARSVLAGKRTTEKLLKKTEWFARLFGDLVRSKGSSASIERVNLDTWGGFFEVKFHLNDMPLRIDENLVDDLLERGSPDAEQRLSHIVDMALGAGVL